MGKRGSSGTVYRHFFPSGKKADIGWDYIGKILLMLVFLFVLFGIIMVISGKSFSIVERIKQLLGM